MGDGRGCECDQVCGCGLWIVVYGDVVVCDVVQYGDEVVVLVFDFGSGQFVCFGYEFVEGVKVFGGCGCVEEDVDFRLGDFF